MTRFSKAVLDYWRDVFAGPDPANRAAASFAVSGTLSPKRPAMILELANGSMQAVVRPEIADRIGSNAADYPSIGDLQRTLTNAGVVLHDPDYLFYLPSEARPVTGGIGECRQLVGADRDAFDMFYQAASEQDREEAFVELDHWAVFGCFDGDRLVSAASMCLWEDGCIADLGVLTLADARGRGFGRTVVGSINDYARRHGHEPQYRCQLDNHASVALARACGLMLFGQWIVATDMDVSTG